MPLLPMRPWLRSSLKVACLVATLSTGCARGQHAPDVELWDEVDATAKLAARTTLTVPLVVRNSLTLANPQLYGFGPFVDAVLFPHLTVTAGYLFVGVPHAGAGYNVHVPVAAVTLRQAYRRLQISDRNRAERLVGLPHDPYRYRNKLVLSSTFARGRWLPFLSDEVFYDFSRSAWSQNRFQAGIGRTLNARLRLDVFYLERNAQKSNPTATHALGTTLEVKFTRGTRREALPHEEN